MPTSQNKVVFETKGFCPICEKNVLFYARREWFRDFLFVQWLWIYPQRTCIDVCDQNLLPDLQVFEDPRNIAL